MTCTAACTLFSIAVVEGYTNGAYGMIVRFKWSDILCSSWSMFWGTRTVACVGSSCHLLAQSFHHCRSLIAAPNTENFAAVLWWHGGVVLFFNTRVTPYRCTQPIGLTICSNGLPTAWGKYLTLFQKWLAEPHASVTLQFGLLKAVFLCRLGVSTHILHVGQHGFIPKV